ncbi:MAG: hypothetical protein AAF742_09955, partial [Pseudomonadota bacterium]
PDEQDFFASPDAVDARSAEGDTGRDGTISSPDKKQIDIGLPPRDEKGRFISRKSRKSDEKKKTEAPTQVTSDDTIRHAEDDSSSMFDRAGGDGGAFAETPEKNSRFSRRPSADDELFPAREDNQEEDENRAFGGRGSSGHRDDRQQEDDDRAQKGAGYVDADFEDLRPAPRHGFRPSRQDETDDINERFIRLDEDDNPKRREPVFERSTSSHGVSDDWSEQAEANPSDDSRRQGPRLREQRRRATALTNIDDLDPIAESLFSDEFFAALNVQPKELEKAIRKARRRAEARQKNRMTPLKAIGWTAWAAALVAIAGAGVFFRHQIVLTFPGAARAYDAVGIEAAPYGVTIEDVAQRVAMSTSGPTIEITGILKSVVEHDVVSPRLKATAYGSSGKILESWTFEPAEEIVPRNGEAAFVTRRAAPIGVVEVALSIEGADTKRPR